MNPYVYAAFTVPQFDRHMLRRHVDLGARRLDTSTSGRDA